MKATKVVGSVVLVAAMSGCATGTMPSQELTDARESIAVAGSQESDILAAQHLSSARTNLAKAEAAADQGEYEVARRAAEKASADARLAAAKARAVATRKKLDELNATLQQLEQQIEQGS